MCRAVGGKKVKLEKVFPFYPFPGWQHPTFHVKDLGKSYIRDNILLLCLIISRESIIQRSG